MKIAVINQKGGVGKTTVAVNLAYELTRLKRRVLLIDLDSQAHSTVIYLPNHSGLSIADALVRNGVDINPIIFTAKVRSEEVPNFSIVPSSLKLGIVAEAISQRNFRERILHNLLKKIESEYDYLLFDCPPTLGVISVNAIYTADKILIPTSYGRYALDGVGDLFATLCEIYEERRIDYRILRNSLDTRTTSTNSFVEEQLKTFQLLNTVIRKNESINQSQINGVPVSVFNPKSHGAIDFQKLAQEVNDGGW